MDGIVNVIKPVGMTSFDVVALVRRWTGTRRVGHTGTLDPDAAGVLTVCIGRATRAVEALTEKDKSYRAELCLGLETDTQDATGTLVAQRDPERDETRIFEAIRAMTGPQQQMPPMHSAVKIGGKRLYELAREGKDVPRSARAITLHRCEPISIRQEETSVRALFDVDCSKGTYIRTLCHDIGKTLGCGGHMSFLLRTRTGPFSLSGAHTLERLAEAAAAGNIHALMLPVDAAFSSLPVWRCSPELAARLRNGQSLGTTVAEAVSKEVAGGEGALPERFRVYESERFLGLGMFEWSDDRSTPMGVRLFRLMEE